MNSKKRKGRLALFTIFALFLGLQVSIFAAVPAGAADPPGWSAQYSSADKILYSVSAVDANTCWAAGEMTSAMQGAVVKTTDGGANWVDRNPATAPKLVDISAVDANTCWAVGGSMILKTADGGANWSIQATYNGYFISSVSAINASTCWVGGSLQTADGYVNRIFRTTNGGTSWQEFDPNVPYSLSGISAVDANTCWAASSGSVSAESLGALVLTTDGGANWVKKAPDNHACFCVDAVDKQVVWYVAIHNEAETGDFSCFVTLDGGATWSSSPILYNPFVSLGNGLSAVNASTAWMAAYELPDKGTICKTTDGNVSWNKQAEYPFVNGRMRYIAGISAVDTNRAWAVGLATPAGELGCTIYHTSNGGWTQAVPQVTSITPNSGSPNTVVNITNLAGSNFQSGATVRLERGATIIDATGVTVTATTITCSFNLSGAPAGAYDVVVRNPDGADGRLTGGFTVNAANPCGAGGGFSILLFGAIMGLFSLAGSGTILRRRRIKPHQP